MEDKYDSVLFEKFGIIECLKKDDLSAVYLADHIFLNKKIILKSLNTITSKDLEKIERFKREGRILAKLEHPNIIRVLDFGTYRESFYISFEYFESRNLRRFVVGKELNEQEKENLIIQVLKALSYAHTNKIIHRDLKPENILVNDSLHLKISDFGLALTSEENFITDQYSIVGTPCYMSPEQIRGEKLTNKSDLFSAGIVFYELITGKNPFLGRDVNESLNNILNYSEDEVSIKDNSVSEIMRQLLKSLLRKNTDERINSAEEGLKLLGAEQSENEPVEAIVTKSKSIYKYAMFFFTIILLSAIFFILKNNFISEQKNIPPITSDSLPNEIAPGEKINSEKSFENNSDEVKSDFNEKSGIKPKLEEGSLKAGTMQIEAEDQIKEAKGILNIDCIPWAEITIDKKIVETTPLKNPVELSAGRHEIIFNHPDYPELRRTIEIISGEHQQLKINLNNYSAYIFCEVHPWGEIFINGNFFGQTPLTSPIRINPGKIRLSIRNPGFSEFTEEIIINSGDTLRIQHKF